jgi:hypothetical protein
MSFIMKLNSENTDQPISSSPNGSKPFVGSSNGFKQRFLFPNDVFNFGKHRGKDIAWVIDNDKDYYGWLIANRLAVTHLIIDYASGNNPEIEEIRHTVDKKNNTLLIRSFKYWILKKEKFVRGKDRKKHISDKVIASYKIDIPFTIRKETKSEWRDYTKFHNDCELVEWEVEVKTYEEPALSNFINEKLKLHGR